MPRNVKNPKFHFRNRHTYHSGACPCSAALLGTGIGVVIRRDALSNINAVKAMMDVEVEAEETNTEVIKDEQDDHAVKEWDEKEGEDNREEEEHADLDEKDVLVRELQASGQLLGGHGEHQGLRVYRKI